MCQTNRFQTLFYAALACSIWLLRPAPAAACGMCECFEPKSWGSYFGDIKAPRNARLLVAAPDAAAVSMRSSTGSTVAIETTPAGADGFLWVKASQPLTAGAYYTIEVSAVAVLGFEALAATDDAPLQVDSVKIETGKTSPICDIDRSARVTITGVRDEQHPGRRIIAQLDLTSGTSTQRVFLPFQAITNEQTTDVAALTPSGNPKCTFARTFTLDDRDAPASARVTLYDLGGNATELADPITFTFGAVRGGECMPVMPVPPMPTQAKRPAPTAGTGGPQDADGGQADPPQPVAGTAGSNNNAGQPATRKPTAGAAAGGTALAGSTATQQPANTAGSMAATTQNKPQPPAASSGGCSAATGSETTHAALALAACTCLLGLRRARRRAPIKR